MQRNTSCPFHEYWVLFPSRIKEVQKFVITILKNWNIKGRKELAYHVYKNLLQFWKYLKFFFFFSFFKRKPCANLIYLTIKSKKVCIINNYFIEIFFFTISKTTRYKETFLNFCFSVVMKNGKKRKKSFPSYGGSRGQHYYRK